MRTFISGGVWKNVEDEILKAAVMKYGKNQWARISSLMPRKSAKQCKARWYEWLDPSIKKTEWSREEEEKLLHLAKIMPSQWRTIAPMLNRTPVQCIEHYEKLLDAAHEKDDDTFEASDDPRRLRPGEIDPHPEAKPARPDAVDMDEDEKEMLNEARARLANTRGKKAKRKQREKQLEEARRLASLQKRRELRAAGVVTKSHVGRRLRKVMNYNSEIPFEHKPAAGFYDVTEEAVQTREEKAGFRRTTIDKLEGPRASDQEARKRRQDAERQKRLKDDDLPTALKNVNEANSVRAEALRTRLALPTPQMSDADLEQLVKVGSNLAEVQAATGADALAGSYGATPMAAPAATPMRTPARTPAAPDTILLEARNLIALTQSSTPLAGGDNLEVHDSDFSGAKPRSRAVATPNVLAQSAAAAGTPAMVAPHMTPRHAVGNTPVRDQLHINTAMTPSDPRAAKQFETGVRHQLRAGLSSLPRPQNEYQVSVPDGLAAAGADLDDVDDDGADADQADIDARRAEAQRRREREEQMLRSYALQHDLPRPKSGHAAPLVLPSGMPSDRAVAETLIHEEMERVLVHEAIKYPLSGKSTKRESHLEHISLAQIEAARLMVVEEAEEVKAELYHGADVELAQLAPVHAHALADLVAVDSQHLAPAAQIAPAARVALQSAEHAALLDAMTKLSERCARHEEVLAKLLGGYHMRNRNLRDSIHKTASQLADARMHLNSYQALLVHERFAIPQRIEKAESDLLQLKAREALLQKRYGALVAQFEELSTEAQ